MLSIRCLRRSCDSGKSRTNVVVEARCMRLRARNGVECLIFGVVGRLRWIGSLRRSDGLLLCILIKGEV